MVTPWGDSGCTEVDIVRFLYGALRAEDSCLDILTTSSDREDRIFDGKYSPRITYNGEYMLRNSDSSSSRVALKSAAQSTYLSLEVFKHADRDVIFQLEHTSRSESARGPKAHGT